MVSAQITVMTGISKILLTEVSRAGEVPVSTAKLYSSMGRQEKSPRHHGEVVYKTLQGYFESQITLSEACTFPYFIVA